MGAKKEALILKALEERQRHAGRHLLADTHELAATLVAYLRERAPDADILPVGSLRRGCETCGDLDILASGAPASLMDRFAASPAVERVLGHGETKSSVLLRGGFQADLRLVAPESRGAAMQYFTGSKAHNIALRDRAMGLGLKLNEYGLFRTADEVGSPATPRRTSTRRSASTGCRPSCARPAARSKPPPGIVCPRSSIAATCAATSTCTPPRPTGTTTCGRWPPPLAPPGSSTSRSPITASRSRWPTASTSAARSSTPRASARSTARSAASALLAGIECDIRPDGTLDLADDCLAALDLVVASVHSAFNQDREQMTARLLRAIDNPHVDILGHPTGRLLLRRAPYAFDIEAVVDAAARHGVALEINWQVDRLDLSDVHARLARDRGVPIVISSDAHSRRGFSALDWGVVVARRAWLEPRHVLNTLPFDRFRGALRRHRL